jgi:bifunctional non-homologous end joining protein LigD
MLPVITPMLATLTRDPFHQAGWVYEEKYDGDRIVAYKEGKRVRMLSRNMIDRQDRFPRIAEAIRDLEPATLILDGEVVVFDGKGISRFQLLQQGRGEPAYAAFDCLFCDGADLRRQPLSARREALERSIRPSKTPKVLLLSRRIASNGLEAFRVAKKRGYEGLLAKDASSAYVAGRSRAWLKVKVHQEDEFVIVGFTKPGGARKYLGALLLGAYHRGKLRFVGKVGTGFNAGTLAMLHRKLRPLARRNSPTPEPIREKDATFVEPTLVAQISYQEWTDDGKLRQPVFLGLRDDKSAQDVHLPEAAS